MTAAAERPILDLRAAGSGVAEALKGEALADLETRILPAFIAARRWYGAKDAGVPSAARVVEAVPFGPPEDPVLLTRLRVLPPGQEAQLYLLPLKIVRQPQPAIGPEAAGPWVIARVRGSGTEAESLLIDALADDGFVQALVAAIRGAGPAAEGIAAGAGTLPSAQPTAHPSGQPSGHSSGNSSKLLFRRSGALAPIEAALDRTLAIDRAGVEQSNTSFRLGGAMILKVFRRLAPGIHPELEMTRFLTEIARFRNVPALLGSVEHRDPSSGTVTALCLLQTLVPNEGDGWSWVLSGLQRSLAETGDVADRRAPEDAIMALIGRLGRRTAELHRALALPTADPAFAPEPIGAEHLDDWTEAVRTMTRSVLDRLEQARPALAEAERVQADRLLDRRSELLSCIDHLPPVAITAQRTRLHGDYHLGQVLVADGDVYIIDFEGEPMRPLAERRAKHSPLRDVAGMLRSFAYAAAAAAKDLPPDLPAERRVALEAALARWQQDAERAFRDGYREAIRGCPSHPADLGHAERLLRLFLLEKALYEVGYELANRPDWIGIPLAGILSLLDEPQPGTEFTSPPPRRLRDRRMHASRPG